MTANFDDLSGMTVNERLFVTSQLKDIDAAVAKGDLARIREILASVHVDETAIVATLENVKIHGIPYDPTWNKDDLLERIAATSGLS